jgi:hypothetical protein
VWDKDELAGLKLPGNLVDLLTGHIATLSDGVTLHSTNPCVHLIDKNAMAHWLPPSQTLSLLQCASCIGQKFKFEQLRFLSDTSSKLISIALLEAAEKGIITPMGNTISVTL